MTFFPHTLLPLHVFEARYRAMVTDVLERDRRLAVVGLQAGLRGELRGQAGRARGGGARRDRRLRAPGHRALQHPPAGRGPHPARAASCRATRSTGSSARTGCPTSRPATLLRALARIRAACRTLLDALQRPANLLDTALAEGQGAGAIADRVAAAVLPDPDLRQSLLETPEVATRVTRVADAVEALVRELKGGRE